MKKHLIDFPENNISIETDMNKVADFLETL